MASLDVHTPRPAVLDKTKRSSIQVICLVSLSILTRNVVMIFSLTIYLIRAQVEDQVKTM